VPENAEPSAVVIKVTANDRDEDSHLTYSIIDGNVGSAFEIVPDTGEIKVRATLDYETGPRVYVGLKTFHPIYWDSCNLQARPKPSDQDQSLP